MVSMQAAAKMEFTDPSGKNYYSLLRESTRLKSLQEGHRVHTHMIIEGLDMNLVLANHLVDMYGKCGCVMEARHTFNHMPNHNVYSWMSLLSAYNNLGFASEVLALYKQMCTSIVPDKYIFVTIFNACTGLLALEYGQAAYIQMSKIGTEMDAFVQSSLINMYIDCGCIIDAYHIFIKTDGQNVVLWNAMILGYVQQGYYAEAMVLLGEMLQKGVIPDPITYVGAIQACADMQLLEKVRQYHMELVYFDYIADLTVSNTLIDTYTKCGSFQDAWGVFVSIVKKDVVSYNVMITSFIQQGFSEKAISLYGQMKQDSLKPNETTFVSILKACTHLRDGERGKKFHKEILKDGCKLNSFLASTLIDMYAKCGMIVDAYEVFCTTEDRNVVVWTAMITGYTQQGFGKESLDLFLKMEQKGVMPNAATMISVLKACSILGAEAMGQKVNDRIKQSSLQLDILVMNGLIEMHASCGNMQKALLAFNEMSERDVVSWTALIGGYAQQGFVKEALVFFKQMLQECVKPNAITFVAVLSACSHAGLIEEGYLHFFSMIREHGIVPTSDQYACMVDLLGRAGHLEEAARIIISMEVQHTELAWRTLLGACRTSSNKNLAKFAMKQIIELNPDNDAAYVLLCNTDDDSRNCFWSTQVDALGMNTLSGLSDDMSTCFKTMTSSEAKLVMSEA
ncbi:hypothetical protein GOP47_0023180 [Adiantum capillus-veneris]|uniref:Pentatricopeptide repeat-containing protein n=1 Tax=Adiantum capillus-veneris TaxID=13818 RepID=A0A9D4U951_ADICA|nr:hypothetical protein GOP47_0023180 [Adiantum capillus-veneris]